MAWYSDEQYVMIQDSREKKSTAASAFKQRTHCGKSGGVKLPSDFMSKKERDAMNGECVEYASLKKPMSWEDFKRLPDDLKKEYINSLREKFNVPNQRIAAMFGIHRTALTPYLKDLGIAESKGGNRTWNKDGWLVWLHDGDPSAVNPSETPVEVVEEAPEEYDLRKPMSWEKFKSMPKELKVEYITWIRDYFGAPDKYIGEMLFKVSNKTMCIYIMDLGIGAGKNSSYCKKAWLKESFQAWIDGAKKEEEMVEDTTPVEDTVEALETAEQEFNANLHSDISEIPELPVVSEECQGECQNETKHAIPVDGEMNFKGNIDDILRTIRLLLDGSEVSMTVSWRTLEK